MKNEQYLCDGCFKVVSDTRERIALDHMSFDLRNAVSVCWVEKRESGKWGRINGTSEDDNVLHFCSKDCLGDFFDRSYRKAKERG